MGSNCHLHFPDLYWEMLLSATSLLLLMEFVAGGCKTGYNERIIVIANIPLNEPPLLIGTAPEPWSLQT